MPTLTVRNLDAELVRRLRLRAAAHGRSAEAEHREILRATLSGDETAPVLAETLARLAAFRQRITPPGLPAPAELLAESRHDRNERLSPEST